MKVINNRLFANLCNIVGHKIHVQTVNSCFNSAYECFGYCINSRVTISMGCMCVCVCVCVCLHVSVNGKIVYILLNLRKPPKQNVKFRRNLICVNAAYF